jgi:acyl carrier protein
MNAVTIASNPPPFNAGHGVELMESLISEIQKILSIYTIDPDVPLIEIGVDSINIVEIMISCENIYGVNVVESDITLDQYTTIRSLDGQLRKSRG